jgi:hypothetical protein
MRLTLDFLQEPRQLPEIRAQVDRLGVTLRLDPADPLYLLAGRALRVP